MLVYQMVRPGSNILDVGCASGYFAKELQKKGCKTWGIEKDVKQAATARRYSEEVYTADLNNLNKDLFPKKFFDYILFLDLLEHLTTAQRVLKLLKSNLKDNGRIIISVPNIAFISIRFALLRGKFEYQNMGIMDKSHVHFYTKKTILNLAGDCGLEIEKVDSACGFSQISLIGKYLNHIPKYWQYKITRFWDTLLAYQFILVCKKIS